MKRNSSAKFTRKSNIQLKMLALGVILGTATYAEGNIDFPGGEVVNDNFVGIKLETSENIFGYELEYNGNTSSKDYAFGNSVTNNGTYYADIKIKSENDIEGFGIGNGYLDYPSFHGPQNSAPTLDFINNGVIKGKTSLESISGYVYSEVSGNGFVDLGFRSKIENTGLISGENDFKGNSYSPILAMYNSFPYGGNIWNGNGILRYNSFANQDTKYANSGVIKGSSKSEFSYLPISYSASLKSNYFEIGKIMSGNGIKAGSSYLDAMTFPFTKDSLVNTGLISGNSITKGFGVDLDSGNGYSIGSFIYGPSTPLYLNEFKNSGIISGNSQLEKANDLEPNGLLGALSGNGVSILGNLSDTVYENNGLIKGNFGLSDSSENSFLLNEGSGNGMILLSENINIKNSGTISGYADRKNNVGLYSYGYGTGSGSGITIISSINTNILNEGVIKGSDVAIASNFYNTRCLLRNGCGIEEIINDGVTAGGQEYTRFYSPFINNGVDISLLRDNNENNYGNIVLDSDGDVVINRIENGIAGISTSGKTILNATVRGDIRIPNRSLDSYEEILNDTNFTNYIINGAGIKKGVLDVASNTGLTLDNSIVNAYKTGVTLNDNSTLLAKDTIFNGGGLKGEDPVINSKGDYTSSSIEGSSILNGNVLVAGNNSTIALDNSVLVNGDILSNESSIGNTVKLGNEVNNNNLKIFGKIDNFSNIESRGNVTLYETASINKGDINITNGLLTVRVDGTKTDEQGRIIGHALYGHKGSVTAGSIVSPFLSRMAAVTPPTDTSLSLLFGVSGLGEGTVIAMNGTDITGLKDTQIGTTSLVHTARKQYSDSSNVSPTGDIKIDIVDYDDLIGVAPGTTIQYRKEIGKIYNSIVNGKQIGYFAPTTDISDMRLDALPELVSMLDQIYLNSPYSYAGKLSKESLGLYRDSIAFDTIMPNEKEYIASGHFVYDYGKFGKTHATNSYGSSVHYEGYNPVFQNNGYKAEGNTTGLLGTVEYGIRAKESLGIAFGGSKQNLSMSGPSKLKGDSIYLGGYWKKNTDRFAYRAGLGYQFNSYDADRIIANKYQGISNEGSFDANGLNLYGEAKYLYRESAGWKVEPKLGLSYTYVDQNSVSEKERPLAIDVDKVEYNYLDTELGFDFTKEYLRANGKGRTILSASYINTLGDSRKDLNARMKNSSEFELRGSELNRNSGKFGIKYEIENNNGMVLSVGTSLRFAKDNEREAEFKLSAGYRF